MLEDKYAFARLRLDGKAHQIAPIHGHKELLERAALSAYVCDSFNAHMHTVGHISRSDRGCMQ